VAAVSPLFIYTTLHPPVINRTLSIYYIRTCKSTYPLVSVQVDMLVWIVLLDSIVRILT
jgi:hypothetical protein